MYAVSSSCFVFSWAAGTAGGGQVVVGEKGGVSGERQTINVRKFPCNTIPSTNIFTFNHAEVQKCLY